MTTALQYITALEEPIRTDVKRLHEMILRALPKVDTTVASGMIGYGKYHYKYESGREGDSYRVALAARKTGISLYVSIVDERGYVAERSKARVGKATVGKSCIKFKKLADVKLEVLAEIVGEARKHPAMGEVTAARAKR